MAFHLHRLKLVGRALQEAGYHKTDAADLAAARSNLSDVRVTALAMRLGVETTELARELSLDERRQWAFYRACAANPQHVWAAARAAWTSKGLTDREAATIMGLKATTVVNTKFRLFALSFTAATRLTTALDISAGPEALLPLPARDNPEQTR